MAHFFVKEQLKMLHQFYKPFNLAHLDCPN